MGLHLLKTSRPSVGVDRRSQPGRHWRQYPKRSWFQAQFSRKNASQPSLRRQFLLKQHHFLVVPTASLRSQSAEHVTHSPVLGLNSPHSSLTGWQEPSKAQYSRSPQVKLNRHRPQLLSRVPSRQVSHQPVVGSQLSHRGLTGRQPPSAKQVLQPQNSMMLLHWPLRRQQVELTQLVQRPVSTLQVPHSSLTRTQVPSLRQKNQGQGYSSVAWPTAPGSTCLQMVLLKRQWKMTQVRQWPQKGSQVPQVPLTGTHSPIRGQQRSGQLMRVHFSSAPSTLQPVAHTSHTLFWLKKTQYSSFSTQAPLTSTNPMQQLRVEGTYRHWLSTCRQPAWQLRHTPTDISKSAQLSTQLKQVSPRLYLFYPQSFQTTMGLQSCQKVSVWMSSKPVSQRLHFPPMLSKSAQLGSLGRQFPKRKQKSAGQLILNWHRPQLVMSYSGAHSLQVIPSKSTQGKSTVGIRCVQPWKTELQSRSLWAKGHSNWSELQVTFINCRLLMRVSAASTTMQQNSRPLLLQVSWLPVEVAVPTLSPTPLPETVSWLKGPQSLRLTALSNPVGATTRISWVPGREWQMVNMRWQRATSMQLPRLRLPILMTMLKRKVCEMLRLRGSTVNLHRPVSARGRLWQSALPTSELVWEGVLGQQLPGAHSYTMQAGAESQMLIYAVTTSLAAAQSSQKEERERASLLYLQYQQVVAVVRRIRASIRSRRAGVAMR